MSNKEETFFIKRQFPLPLSDSTKIGYTCKAFWTTWDNVTQYCPFCGRKVVRAIEYIKVGERVEERTAK